MGLTGIDYLPGNSWLHRLDARTKIIWFIALTILMLFLSDPLWLALLTLLVYSSLYLCGIDREPVHSFLRGLTPICVIYFLSNLWLNPAASAALADPRNILFYVVPPLRLLPITAIGILVSTAMLLRLLLIVLAVRLLTLTTQITDIVRGLTKWHLPPAAGIAVGIGFGFIPVLVRTTRTITDAQRARGWAGVTSGSFIQRTKALPALLLPIMFFALKSAQNIAVAIESRGYGYNTRRRTWRVEPRFGPADRTAFLLLALIALAIILLRWYDLASWRFTLGLFS